MAVKKIKIENTQDVLIPAASLQRLLDIRDGNAALAYLYILSHGGELEETAASSRLGLSASELAASLDLLSRNKLIDTGVAPAVPDRPDTLPEYTAGDVADAAERDSSFRYLLNFTEKRLGKMLSTVDTRTLLGIYSWMGLPVDVICLLIVGCIEDTKKKYGESRKPTMRAIEQRAKLWLNMGIMTQEAAEEYLKEQERRGTRTAQISRLLYLGGRPLSATESRYIADWIAMDLSDEVIMKAYDITVVKTGSMKWRYMDTILKSWHAKGFKTVAEIDAGEAPGNEHTAAPAPAVPAADELESLRKLREINRKRRGEEK